MDTTEILEGATLKLVFDGKPYQVRPLNIGKARTWRKQLAQLDVERVKSLNEIKEEEGARFGQAMTETNPDFLVNLVVSYCELATPLNGSGPVTRDLIEAGTLTEVGEAFEKIVAVEFPLQAVTAGQKALVAAWSR